MGTSHYRGSVLGPVLTFKRSLLAICCLPAIAYSQSAALCETYTPGLLCLDGGYGLSVSAEGLYFVTREHHLIVTTSKSDLSSTSQIPPALDRWDFRGDMIRIEPTWDWGYRVGLGYTSSCDYWDAFAYWTSFSTSDDEKVDVIDLPGFNLWGHADTQNAARLFAAAADWHLSYDLIDVSFGRAFWIGHCLVFRPFFGARGAWIDQSLSFQFDFQPQNPISFSGFSTHNCDFSGGGLKTGFNLIWTTGGGFGVYSELSLSLLYGQFQSNFSQTETTNFSSMLIADSSDPFYMGIPALDGKAGLKWDRCFCQNRFRFGLHLGWEFQLWNDLNHFNHFLDSFSSGIFLQENTSLCLMGLSFGGGFDF